MKTFLKHSLRVGLFAPLMLLAACASGGLDYAPRSVPSFTPAEAPVPVISAAEAAFGYQACLYDAAKAKGVLFEVERLLCAAGRPEPGVAEATLRLARLAYQPETEQFRALDLAPNMRIEPDDALLSPLTRYRFADDYRMDGERGAGVIAGRGVALVAVSNEGAGVGRAFTPPEGFYRPVTLTIRPERKGPEKGGSLVLHLEAHAPPEPPLKDAAEHAYLHLLDHATVKYAASLGFLNAEKMTTHPDGIYMIEPYDPDRIPLLLIHGLRSNPLVWEVFTRAVLSDPALHARYQVWHAFYPTGLPPFYNTAVLRGALHNLIDTMAGENDMARRHIAVIGHSMGGLIARLLVTEDDGALWRETFNVPVEELKMAPERRDRMAAIFSARHEPQIGFAAFINTPHRGSDTANSLIGQIGSALVSLPERFEQIFRQDEAYLEQATPTMYRYLRGGGPDSIRVLSPNHPLLKTLAEQKIAPGVHHVSVVGVKEGRGCLEDPKCEATDGVVAYESAHLSDGSEELVVKSGHDSYRHPEAVAFLVKQLKAWTPEQ